MLEIRILRKMCVQGRPVAPGVVLELTPRQALDACCGGGAEPVNRQAYLDACKKMSEASLRASGASREHQWSRRVSVNEVTDHRRSSEHQHRRWCAPWGGFPMLMRRDQALACNLIGGAVDSRKGSTGTPASFSRT